MAETGFMSATVKSLATVAFPAFRDPRGVLGVAELPETVPFPVVRVFWISDVPHGAARGGHAHRLCNQFLICMAGRIEVVAFDGAAERPLLLEAGSGLHVPPGIFATEIFHAPGSVLAVLCDRPYERDDYIATREAFLDLRRGRTSQGGDRA